MKWKSTQGAYHFIIYDLKFNQEKKIQYCKHLKESFDKNIKNRSFKEEKDKRRGMPPEQGIGIGNWGAIVKE